MKNSKRNILRPRVGESLSLISQNIYAHTLYTKYSPWFFSEKQALQFKDCWRSHVFHTSLQKALDLEIGIGNGFHFAHLVQTHKDRILLGIEKKLKPLVQSLQRACQPVCQNMGTIRYDAKFLHHLFGKNELNNIYIHFPDPWPKRSQKKHRLIDPIFLNHLYQIQRKHSFVEFKTDNQEYFDLVIECVEKSSYFIQKITYNLHASEFAKTNYITHFEKIFVQKGFPIFMCQFVKVK